MLKNILSSSARVEILKLLIFNPENRYYIRQISRITGQSLRAVQRELENLRETGLVGKESDGNRIYYSIDKDCPIYEDLKNIFFKVEGIGNYLREYLEDNTDAIEFAFIYGSYARGEERLSSDIDLMVIGEITSRKLSSVLSDARDELNREINYIVFSVEELKARIRDKEHFVTSVISDDKIFIVGDESEFERFIR
ncbi:MAG: nucleotidyltransferase domain-containing protein [Candidatus Krumholzibacteriales bacterium]